MLVTETKAVLLRAGGTFGLYQIMSLRSIQRLSCMAIANRAGIRSRRSAWMICAGTHPAPLDTSCREASGSGGPCRVARGGDAVLNASMEVANPIYDAVFKYLLDDEQAARLLIGQITGLDVQSLTVSPQEAVAPRHGGVDPDAPPSLTLFRMDFAARVRTADGGTRQVLVEIQKAKAPTVVERFRLYLGQQYASRDNIVTDGRGASEAVPIVTIYLLGYDLGLSEEAVLDVCPRVTERRTGRVLDAGHPFVEGIHHRSHIVQIPRLRRGGEDELTRFLTIFDQGRALAERDNHVLAIEEGEYPAAVGVRAASAPARGGGGGGAPLHGR